MQWIVEYMVYESTQGKVQYMEHKSNMENAV